MEAIEEKKMEAPVEPKKSFGKKFLNFLMMGGFLLVLIVGVIIFVAISIALK